MKFLCSFLSHHFAGKPVVAPVNVGCFLALPKFLLDDRLQLASTDRLIFWFFISRPLSLKRRFPFNKELIARDFMLNQTPKNGIIFLVRGNKVITA